MSAPAPRAETATPQPRGRWPASRVAGLVDALQTDWNSTGRLHAFFDGDRGAGLGADNQVGWTALVVNLIAEGWPAATP